MKHRNNLPAPRSGRQRNIIGGKGLAAIIGSTCVALMFVGTAAVAAVDSKNIVEKAPAGHNSVVAKADTNTVGAPAWKNSVPGQEIFRITPTALDGIVAITKLGTGWDPAPTNTLTNPDGIKQANFEFKSGFKQVAADRHEFGELNGAKSGSSGHPLPGEMASAVGEHGQVFGPLAMNGFNPLDSGGALTALN